MLLLHSQERGQALVEELGRAARLGQAQGVPANVIPVALWHTASTGVDLWLSAIAFGARQVVVLATAEEAPQYLDGLQAQMDVAQAILSGLGYAGTHFELLQARVARSSSTGRCSRCAARAQQRRPRTRRVSPSPPKSARRSSWRWTTWSTQAPARPEAIALPAAARPSAASPSTRTSARCA